MHGIIFQNFSTHSLECLSTCMSFKNASDYLLVCANLYMEENPIFRPLTFWKTDEFKLDKIRQDTANPNGFWLNCFTNEILVYQKKTFNRWFGSIEIDLFGKFSILDLPEILPIPIEQPKPKLSSSNFQHGNHVSMIDELKHILKHGKSNYLKPVSKPSLSNVENVHQKFLKDLQHGKLHLRHIN